MTSRLGMELVSDWPHWAALVHGVYIFGRASSSLLSLALYYHISTTDHQAPFAFVLVIVTLYKAHSNSIPAEEVKKPKRTRITDSPDSRDSQSIDEYRIRYGIPYPIQRE